MEKLHNTEQVTSVVEKCETASTELVTMVDKLVSNMKESIFGNETIVSSAQGTDEDCGKSLKREIDCRIDRILTRTQSKKKQTRPDMEDRYRYICQSVPFDYIDDDCRSEYDITLRIVRFETAPGCFENIITNLPDIEFDFEDFKELYHMRWDEGNSFQELKHPLCLKAFHSKKYEFIVQEILARAILHNFSSAIISGVDIGNRRTKYEYQINFAEAFKIYRDFLRIHDKTTKMKVEDLIAQNIEPIKLGRTFARQHRFKLPISFCYRC